MTSPWPTTAALRDALISVGLRSRRATVKGITCHADFHVGTRSNRHGERESTFAIPFTKRAERVIGERAAEIEAFCHARGYAFHVREFPAGSGHWSVSNG